MAAAGKRPTPPRVGAAAYRLCASIGVRTGPTPWGRGVGEGIGISGHKNEYKAGVRIGNWVEEQFGREAYGVGHTMKVGAATANPRSRHRTDSICSTCAGFLQEAGG